MIFKWGFWCTWCDVLCTALHIVSVCCLRVMAILDPIKVIITNFPFSQVRVCHHTQYHIKHYSITTPHPTSHSTSHSPSLQRHNIAFTFTVNITVNITTSQPSQAFPVFRKFSIQLLWFPCRQWMLKSQTYLTIRVKDSTKSLLTVLSSSTELISERSVCVLSPSL